jgi:hypothetical protein
MLGRGDGRVRADARGTWQFGELVVFLVDGQRLASGEGEGEGEGNLYTTVFTGAIDP